MSKLFGMPAKNRGYGPWSRKQKNFAHVFFWFGSIIVQEAYTWFEPSTIKNTVRDFYPAFKVPYSWKVLPEIPRVVIAFRLTPVVRKDHFTSYFAEGSRRVLIWHGLGHALAGCACESDGINVPQNYKVTCTKRTCHRATESCYFHLYESGDEDKCCNYCKGCEFLDEIYSSGQKWQSTIDPCVTFTCNVSSHHRSLLKGLLSTRSRMYGLASLFT